MKMSARVTAKDLELGAYGTKGGRTVTIEFKDGGGMKVGTLIVSGARIRWKSSRGRDFDWVNVRNFDEMFGRFFEA